MRARTAMGRLPRGIVRFSDRLLEFVVFAFAAWTIVYHAALALDLAALAAGAVWAGALVPSTWLSFRVRDEGEHREDEPPDDREPRARPTASGVVLRVAAALAALTSSALYAFTDTPWSVIWAVWIVAATAALAATILALRGRDGGVGLDRTPRDEAAPGVETAVVLAWAVALVALSLFLVNPSGDDTHYVHLSAWIAAHGRFPLRDILFSTEDLPAIIFPPMSSLEALAGTVARATGLAVPDVVYLVVAPLASTLAVLALWRLLRTWSAPMVGLTLSLSLVFLVMTAEEHRQFGGLFVARLWQGKIVFLAVLVPLLFALFHEYAETPTRRRLALLAAAGAAGVGLTSTATFLVPVIAAGALLPVAARSPARAATALSATVAYPLVMAAGIAVFGARNAAVTRPSNLESADLVERTFGEGGGIAFITLAAVLLAPVLLRSALAGAMAAGIILLVGLLYTPGVPLRIFTLTGLGQVQWRWMWAIPAAALVAVVGTGLLRRVRPRVLRAAPALGLGAALVALGTPVWSADTGATLARKPAWKLHPANVRAAESILEHLGPGESVLAPRRITQTVLVMSGETTGVAPRDFYTRALRGVRGGHGRARILLLRFSEHGLGPVETSAEIVVEPAEVAEALQVVRVDLACVASDDAEARQLLVEQGYSFAVAAESLACLRAPE